jgi:hypothetical protein
MIRHIISHNPYLKKVKLGIDKEEDLPSRQSSFDSYKSKISSISTDSVNELLQKFWINLNNDEDLKPTFVTYMGVRNKC